MKKLLNTISSFRYLSEENESECSVSTSSGFRKHLLLWVFALAAVSAQAVTLSLQYSNESRCVQSGSLAVTAAAGTAPYQYRILSGPGFPSAGVYQASNVFNNLLPGSYEVEVRDATTATATLTVVVAGSYAAPTFVVDSVRNEACPCTGVIFTRVSANGRAPFKYRRRLSGTATWSAFQDSSKFVNVCTGTYEVQVEDSCGNFQTINNVTVGVQGGEFKFDINSIYSGASGNGNDLVMPWVIRNSCGTGTIIYAFSVHGAGTYCSQHVMAVPNAGYTSYNNITNFADASVNSVRVIGGTAPIVYTLTGTNGYTATQVGSAKFENIPLTGVYTLEATDACGRKFKSAVTAEPLPLNKGRHYMSSNCEANTYNIVSDAGCAGGYAGRNMHMRQDTNSYRDWVRPTGNQTLYYSGVSHVLKPYRAFSTPGDSLYFWQYSGVYPKTFQVVSGPGAPFPPIVRNAEGLSNGGYTPTVLTNADPTATYIVKVTDACGQVVYDTIAPNSSLNDTLRTFNFVWESVLSCPGYIGKRYDIGPESGIITSVTSTPPGGSLTLGDYVTPALGARLASGIDFIMKKGYTYTVEFTGVCTGTKMTRVLNETATDSIWINATFDPPCVAGTSTGSITATPQTRNFSLRHYALLYQGEYNPSWTQAQAFRVHPTSAGGGYNFTFTNLPAGTYTVMFGSSSQARHCLPYKTIRLEAYQPLKSEIEAAPICAPATSAQIAAVNTALGKPTYKYQIKLSSDPISSYSSPAQLSPIFTRPAGTYDIRVVDSCYNSVIVSATLGPVAPPALTSNLTTCANSDIVITSNKIRNMRYRWYKQGTLVPSQTTNVFTHNNAVLADAGVYRCEITDTVGTCGTLFTDITIAIVTDPNPATINLPPTLCGADTLILTGGNTNAPAPTSGNWTFVSGPAVSNPTIVNPTSPTTIALPTPANRAAPYVFRWTYNNGTCHSNRKDTVLVMPKPTLLPGSDIRACEATSTNLTARPLDAGYTGRWTQISGPATTIVDRTSPTSSVTGLSFPNTYRFRWTVYNVEDTLSCFTMHEITLRNSQKPSLAMAGRDTLLCGGSDRYRMSATPTTIGTGRWTALAWPSIISAPNPVVIAGSSITSPTASYDLPAAGTYMFEWQTYNEGCDAYKDTVIITRVVAKAGVDVNVCTSPPVAAKMAAAKLTPGFTGTWSVAGNSPRPGPLTFLPNANSDTANVLGYTAGKYWLVWTVTSSGCTATDTAILSANVQPTKPNAGADQTGLCTNSTILIGTLGHPRDSSAFRYWQKIDGPLAPFTKYDSLTTGVNLIGEGTYQIQLEVIQPGCLNVYDTMMITKTGTPPVVKVDSFKNPTCAGLSNGIIYISSTPTINQTHEYRINGGNWQSSKTFTGLAAGTYNIEVRNALAINCVNSIPSPVTLTPTNSAPTANAGRDTAICAGRPVVLGAASVAGHTYSWAASLGLSATSISNPTFTIGVSNVYSRTLEVTHTASGCKAYDTVVITVNPLPTPVITSSNAAMCGGQTRTLTATPSGGTFIGAQVSGTTFTAPATAGSYTIRYAVTNAQGCSDTATQTIVVNPKVGLTTVSFSPTSVCVGFTTTATSTPTGGTWSVVSGPATINAGSGLLSATGSTLVTVRYIHPGTSGASCPDTVTATITPIATPIANITSAATPMCVNATRALTGTPAGGTFTVVSGGGSIIGTTLTATAPGTISLRYSVTSSGCSDDTIVSIVVNAIPTVSITSSSAAMCPGETRTLVGSPTGGTFSGTGVSGTTFTAPATAGNYTITYSYTDANTCSNTATQTITVNPLVSLAAVTFSPTTVCSAGGVTTATSTPAGGNWSVVSGPGTIVGATGALTASGSTAITVRYSHPGVSGTSCPATIDGTITPTASPVANITSAVTPMCVNATRALTGTPAGGTFTVLSGGGSITGTTLTATGAGTISLRYSVTSSGCSDDTVVSIVVNALPTVSITSSSASMCPSGTRTLVGTPAGGTFSGTGVSGTTFTAPATAGNYSITYSFTDANTCTNTTTQTITVNPLVSLGAITFSPATVCSAGGTTTAAGTPAGGTWSVVSGPATINSSSGILTATGTGAITVRYSHPGVSGSSCPTTIDGTITPTASPVATVTSSTTAMCVNSTRALTGTPAGGTFTVVSGGGAITGTTLVATAPGTISLRYSVTSSGCSDDTVVSIVVNALPTVSITSSSASMCPSGTRTLVGSPAGGTFTGTGVAAGVFTAPVTAGNNTITYSFTDANTCTNTTTQTIAVNPLVTLSSVTFSKATVCVNAAANSTASASPAGGSWSVVSGPATINASSGAITATGVGAITVRYSHPGVSGTSCPNTVDATINGVANPTATPTASANPICNGSSATIAAGQAGGLAPYTYSWAATGGGSAQSHTASPNTNTVYQVTVTDVNMCTASGSITLSVTGSTPLMANAGNDREICSGTATSLGGSPTANGGAGGYTYNWSSAAGAIANPSVSPTATTSYYLTVQSSGCSAFDTVVVTVNAKPLISPSANSSAICIGNSTTLNGGGSGGTGALSYTWSNNATGTPITVSPTVSTTYTVTVKDAKLCEAVGSVAITVNPLPIVSITSSAGNICQGSTRTLVGSPAGGTFTGTGVSGSTFTASTPGSYSIIYSFTNGNGCTNTAMQTIVVDPTPIVSAGDNDTICLGASKVLTGSQVSSLTGVLYEWYVLGSTTPIPPQGTTVTVSPMTTTNYEFVGTKGNCSHKATMNLGVVGKPNLIEDMTACQAATEDVATTWPLTNITANDMNTSVIKGGVTYSILSVKHGTASISGADINYQASPNYNGLDTLTVVGTSNFCSNLKDTAIFCVNVASVNDAPIAVNDTATTPMGTPVSKNLLTNDSDVDHTLTGATITIVKAPTNGTLGAIDASGTVTYTPNANFVGIDTVEYEVCDAGMPVLCARAFAYFNVTPKIADSVRTTAGNTSTPISVGPALTGTLESSTVTPSNVSGTAVIDPMTGVVTITPSITAFIGKDTFVRIVEVMTTNGLVRDTSFIVIDNPNRGDTLREATNRNTPVSFPKLLDVNLKGTALVPVVDPTLTINSDGTVTYTPKPDFVGIDTARIVRCDNLGNCHTTVYIVTVNPDLSDSATLTTSGTPVTVELSITRYPGQSINTSVLNPTDNGTVVVNPDGSVTYTPNAGFIGRDTLVREVCVYDTASMKSICDTIRTIFTVVPKPLDDRTITPAGTATTAGKPIATLPGTRTDITKTDPINGTALVNPDGTVSYTPNPGFVGSDTVRLTVCVYDSVSMKTICNTSIVVFHILPVNSDVSTGTNMNTPVTAGNPVLRIPGTSVDITKTGPSNGTATVNPDGTVTYTPRTGFVGRDSVTRIVCIYDSASMKTVCDTVLMFFNVFPVNPDTAVTTLAGKPITAGGPVPSLPGIRTDISLSGPANGSAIVNPDGTVTYTPRVGFSGVDTIRRIICRYDSVANTTYCDTSLIIVTVELELAQIPNYFSPNGDGVNDVWNLDGLLSRYPNARAIIYNRWGNIVWRSSGPYGKSTASSNIWYGQLEGSQDMVPDGVYYYLLELEDEFKTTKTGFIEVMRQ